MRVYCTYCSARKRTDSDDLPAIERYTSRRIDGVAARAKRDACAFAILSGKLGFILGREAVPYYDHLLTDPEVGEMSKRVAGQMARLAVSEAMYFTVEEEVDPKVRPYREVMEGACVRAGVQLTVCLL